MLALALASTEEQDIAPIPEVKKEPATGAGRKPPRGKRAPLPAELERVEVLHDVPESERLCPCGTPMVVIGQDVSEQLDIVPLYPAACQDFTCHPPFSVITCRSRIGVVCH